MLDFLTAPQSVPMIIQQLTKFDCFLLGMVVPTRAAALIVLPAGIFKGLKKRYQDQGWERHMAKIEDEKSTIEDVRTDK